MRILLVDDHDLFREGLKYLIPELDDSVQFFEASNVAAVEKEFSGESVDLILLDYYMPGVIGLDALKTLRDMFDSAMLVIVSGEEDPKVIRAAIENGASGYIPKTSSREDLEHALQIVLGGGTYLPPANFSDQNDARTGHNGAALDEFGTQLSRRQYEVLMKLIQGKSNKVIARELEISDQTVKTHLSQAFRILGVKSRTEAVYIAAKLGMHPWEYPMD